MENSVKKLSLVVYAFEQAVTENLKTAKEKEHDPKAEVRNRGLCVFPAEHPKVKDDKDHFPITNKAQAQNALARANQFSEAPEWYKGSLESLVSSVARAVKKHYPSIEVTEAAKKPGKG
jgi:hypothetical protein